MYRPFLFSTALALASVLSAQSYVHQVLVLNEGYYDVSTQTQVVPVSLGSYDPNSGQYQAVATIADARFGNHVRVDGAVVYVAADHRLLKYDANTFTLLGEADVPGIRRFAFWNDAIVITLGEVGGLPHNCEVRDKNTLELLYSIPASDLPYGCEAVEVVGNKAYIAVNNGFDWGNATALLGVLDLQNQTWEASIDLGPNGLNPEHIMVQGDAVYTFNNKDFTGSSVSKVDLGGAGLVYTNDVALSSGCGASALVENRVYFMEYAQNVLNRYDLSTDAVLDTLQGSPATYGLIDDPINQVMYGTTTDFLTSGTLHVIAYDGTVLSSVPVGVSPGRLALDVRSITGISAETRPAMGLYPNPVEEVLTVRFGRTTTGVLHILDAAGRTVRSVGLNGDATVDVAMDGLAPGLYTARSTSGTVARFVRR